MSSPFDKLPRGGVANWEHFLTNGLRMGLSMLEIMQKWMLQGCSCYQAKKSGDPFLRQLFTYARFTEEQLEAAIRICWSDSFQQQLPEARRRIIIREIAENNFSDLHFESPRPHAEGFFLCRESSKADSSSRDEIFAKRIGRLELRLIEAEELARKEHLHTIHAERQVKIAEKQIQEANKRAQVAEELAQHTQMQAKQLEKQFADIKLVLSQLGQLFQSNEKPAMSPGSHSNGNPNDEPPDMLVDLTFGCDVMIDPVVAADGHTYEKKAIEEWFAKGKTVSPTTGAELESLSLISNYKVRKAISEWHEKRGGDGSAAVASGGGRNAAVASGGSAVAGCAGGGSAVAGCAGGGSAVVGGGGGGRVPFDWDSVPVVSGGLVAWSSDSDSDDGTLPRYQL